MSKTIIVDYDNRIECNSYLLIRPFSEYYKKSEKYTILNQEKLFQKISYLKNIQTYSLEQLPEMYCYLDKNIPKHLFLQIHKEVYNTSKKITLKDYPYFLIHLKDILGFKDYKDFENLIFLTFKPLTLMDILDLYKNSPFFIKEKSLQILKIIEDSYIEKKVSVLTFSSHVCENIIIERLKQNI